MFKNFNWLIVILLFFIFLLGLAVLYSVAPEFAGQQIIYFLFGLLLFILFSQLDYRLFPTFSFWFYFGSILFLLLTFILGRATRGTLRWITLGPLTLQPSELIKPFFILSFSGLAFSRDLTSLKTLLKLLLLFVPLAFLIFHQPALGSFLVVCVIWLAIIFSAGMNLWHLLAVLVASIFLWPLGWRFLADYQKKRILDFLNPRADPLGGGYHLIQAKIAVGSGRIFGKGLGQGTQSHLRFLPEFQSDFIFAALAEELGLLGSLILVICYTLLLYQILKVAEKAPDRFGFLICVGVFAMVFCQFLVNVGMNIGLLPVTGITFPLVSYGGSSLVATMISLGLVESVARVEKKSF